MRKIKLTRANKSILLKALAPYYYREKALGHSTEKAGRLILKINALPADKRASFSAEEIRLMRTTINQLRNERLAKQKEQHPIRCCSWCDREDSNLWPSGSEPNALSS